MFALHLDIFGYILTECEDAMSFAATCRAALVIVKSLFDIVENGNCIIIHGRYGVWILDVHECYVTPVGCALTHLDEVLTCDRDNIGTEVAREWRGLGVAKLLFGGISQIVVYNLAEVDGLKYFGQRLALLGPIRGVYNGEPREFGGNVVKMDGVVLFLA